MIKSVTVINYLNEALYLDLLTPQDSGFEVHDISGLGPVKATINTSKTATLPGVKVNSTTVDGRNIVLTLGLLNFPTVEEARQRTYQYFPLQTEVNLLIESDTRLVTTKGYVESNEPSIFAKETTSVISIICEDAYFFDASENYKLSTVFYATEKTFEFPFENDSLTEPLLVFGNIQSIYEKQLTYTGDNEVGMVLDLAITGPVQNLVIYNPITNEALRISHANLVAMTGSGLVAGDRVVIDTRRGQKAAYLLRSGLQINILNALGRNIDWLTFTKGINTIAYNADSGVDKVQLTLETNILYEGV